MEKLPLVVPQRNVAEASQHSHSTRLHALALQAARERDGLPVLFDRDVDLNIPKAVLADWKQTGRARSLKRQLTISERGAVESRAAALELALAPFSEDQQASAEANVGAMFSGFRAMRQQGEAVAAAITITLGVLRDFPAWAIERACLKIARNEVDLDARYAPNDGQIADVIREVIRPYRQAFDQTTEILSAKVDTAAALSPPRDQRPSYDELVTRCNASGIPIGRKPDLASNLTAEQAERTNAARADEYRRAGLDPPAPQHGLIVSLSMMLSVGWIVEEVNGQKVLVSPLPEKV